MDAIKSARELGKAIQADERFKAYFAAKDKNDTDEALQDLIGEFNLQRMNLTEMASKGDKEQAKVDELNEKMRETYNQIMSNENMRAFSAAKAEIDILINHVNQIIAMCCDGADPDTCEPAPPKGGCGSGCGSCGGCN